MPVDISIKGVPDALAEALRRRAAAHNRTVEEEVIAILEAAIGRGRTLTASGLRSPSESVAIIREDRDTDHGRSRPDAGEREPED